MAKANQKESKLEYASKLAIQTIVPALAGVLVLDRLTESSFISALLILGMAAWLIAVPFFLLPKAKRRVGWPGAIVLCCLAEFFSLLAFSQTLRRSIDLDATWEPSQDLERALNGDDPQIRDLSHNKIRRVRPAAASRERNGDIHILLDFQWRRIENLGSFPIDRTYEGRVHLLAQSRGSGATAALGPVNLVQYSIWPVTSPTAYLLAWVDGPMIMQESRFIEEWVQERTSGDIARKP
jgi:hypothetical protein